MQDITNNVALITGGGTGIGRATALLLASHGADIAVNFSRSENEAHQTVVEIQELGRRAVAVQADVSDETAVGKMIRQVGDEFGRLDILVNNAAITQMVPYTDLDQMTAELWDRIMAVNVKGAFFCCRDAMPLLKADGGGQIINVSSIAGLTGLGSSIAYAASKAALINMTRALAASQAPSVRVNAVAPGVVETRWVRGWEKYTDPHRERTPMKRHAQPADIATTIFGLVINPYITGQVISIDGGRTLGVT